VFHAYNDRYGVTHEFILNGLLHANRVLGYDAFNTKEWKVIGEYDKVNGRHHAFVAPLRDVTIAGVFVKANERIFIEQSLKYNDIDKFQLWEAAGLAEGANWMNTEANYGQSVPCLCQPCPTFLHAWLAAYL
jgi:uncharacterized SAM-dependent methyltransferase